MIHDIQPDIRLQIMGRGMSFTVLGIHVFLISKCHPFLGLACPLRPWTWFHWVDYCLISTELPDTFISWSHQGHRIPLSVPLCFFVVNHMILYNMCTDILELCPLNEPHWWSLLSLFFTVAHLLTGELGCTAKPRPWGLPDSNLCPRTPSTVTIGFFFYWIV